jgi:hypothetical protein
MLVFKDRDISNSALHYCRTFNDLHTSIKRKRSVMLTKSVIVLRDHAHLHAAHTVQDALCFMCWKMLDHLPYNPDLPPWNSMCSIPSWKHQGATESDWRRMPRLWWCSGSSSNPGISLCGETIRWCIKGIPALMPIGTVNSLCIFTTTIPKYGFHFNKPHIIVWNNFSCSWFVSVFQ